jgi:hypothetical protein
MRLDAAAADLVAQALELFRRRQHMPSPDPAFRALECAGMGRPLPPEVALRLAIEVLEYRRFFAKGRTAGEKG